jgi:hypothetical protein
MIRRTTRLAAICVATAAIALQPGSASAKTTSWQDPVGDTNNAGRMDIGKVTVTNTSKKISVKFRFPKAVETYPAAVVEVYIDTNRKKSGPEYVWGLGIPGDSAFTKIGKNGRSKSWAGNVIDKKCGSTVRERFDLEAGVASISVTTKKSCLGKPKSIRTKIHTKITGEFPSDFNYDDWVEYDTTESDYFPDNKRKYSPWVSR